MRALRRRVFEILETGRPDDRASVRCDVFLVTLILLNVLATILESVREIGGPLRRFFSDFELLSVAIFSVEYLLRSWSCVESGDPRYRHSLRGRVRHAFSFSAVVDLVAVLPFYLSTVVPIDLRFLRVLRLLRIFKLSHYFSALDILLEAVRTERRAFGAAFFLLTLGTLFAASGIYLFEHETQPVAFGSIPAAMWWAVATLTTVGYGDVTPVTVGGKIFGASITILGIGMVALPTGILASGFNEELRRRRSRYDAAVRDALEDGVIDADERVALERVRHDLGLTEESVASAGDALRSRTAPAPRPAPECLAALEKCPHCGESLEADVL